MIFFIILPFTLLNRSLSFHHWSFSGRNVKSFQNRPRISSTARSNNNRLETWQFGFSYISRRNILIENHQLVKRWWKKINTPDIQSSPFFIWLFIDELRTYPERIVDQTFFWGTTTVSFNFTIITKPLWRSQTTDLTLDDPNFKKMSIPTVTYWLFRFHMETWGKYSKSQWMIFPRIQPRKNQSYHHWGIHPLLSVFIFQLNASQPNTNQTKCIS